jgi:transcription initiation factor TFIID subunit 2
MPALIEMEEAPQGLPTNEPTFSVIQQEVELDVDFGNRQVTGWTELTIEPQSDGLRMIKLCSRGIRVRNVTVEGKYQVPDASIRYYDPYDGLRVRETYNVHQYHQVRENIEAALRDPPEPNLIIPLPKQVRIRQVSPLDVGPKAQVADVNGVKSLETPVPKGVEDGDPMFVPITVRMEFTMEDTRHALHWAGLQEGDTRYPHVYTTASSVPGTPSSFVFPCVGTPLSRCSWRLTIQCPRTLGDVGRKPRTDRTLANGSDQHTHTNGTTVPDVVAEDMDMLDVDSQNGDDFFASTLIEEERDRELAVVGSGFMEDSDAPLENNPSKRKWVFYCETPVAAHHIGFVIGPFEQVNLTGFRESDQEEKLKDNAVNVHGFCLPGRAAELRNIGMPLTMAMDHVCLTYSPYPFMSASLSYKICFVDDLTTDVLDTATLSICSSRHLIPENIQDNVFESSRVLIRAVASQWVGVHITPKNLCDYWIIVGTSFFMADFFMQTVWGKNEYRYRQYLAAKKVAETDTGRPSIHDLGAVLSVDPSELEFLKLKAPAVLFILHQRLIKKSGHLGVPKIISRMLADVKQGRLVDGEIDTSRFLYSTEKVGHTSFKAFFEEWVYGAGCPTFSVTQRFNKKKMVVEMAITQKQGHHVDALATDGQKLDAENFMREVKEHQQYVYAGATQPVFSVSTEFHYVKGVC